MSRFCLRWIAGLLLSWTLAAGATSLPASGTVEVYFTPWDDAEGAIIRTLGEARQTIHVQAYLLTSRSIATALRDAKARGVAVSLLADRDMVEKSDTSQVPKLAADGIAVWLETRYAIAHSKVMLIDATGPDGILITGSYNFTWSAQARNAENVLILRQNPAVSKHYLANWLRHRDDATAFVYGARDGR